MEASAPKRPRWIIPLLIVVCAIAFGWLLGSQFGSTADNETPVEDATAYRDVAGTVVRLAPEDGIITVDHEEIPGFMAAMIMDLEVADPDELDRIAPGDRILFDLVELESRYRIVRIRKQAATEGDKREPVSTAPTLDRGDLVPALSLVDHRGEPFELRGRQPRHKVITFFYINCPLADFCPAQSRRLSQLQQQLDAAGSDLHMLSISLDAERDDPDALARYARRFALDPERWTLAGGEDANAIRAFAEQAGANVSVDEAVGTIDHALVALRLDGDRIVDRVYGLDQIAGMIRDSRSGSANAE